MSVLRARDCRSSSEASGIILQFTLPVAGQELEKAGGVGLAP